MAEMDRLPPREHEKRRAGVISRLSQRVASERAPSDKAGHIAGEDIPW